MIKMLNANKIKVIGIAASVMAALLVGECSTSTNPVSFDDDDGSVITSKFKLPDWFLREFPRHFPGLGQNYVNCTKKILKKGEITECKGTVKKFSDTGVERSNGEYWVVKTERYDAKPVLAHGFNAVKIVKHKCKIGSQSSITVQSLVDNADVGRKAQFDSPVGVKYLTKAVGIKRTK